MPRIICNDIENLLDIFEMMYPPKESVRHWIIVTTKEPKMIFIQPNVSTPLNSFLLENPPKRARKSIKDFAGDRIKIIQCPALDIKDKRITCESAEDILRIFKMMYPPKVRIRHWIIMATEEPKMIFIQPNVSTLLNSFLLKNLSEDEENAIKDFAGNRIKIIPCPTFEI